VVRWTAVEWCDIGGGRRVDDGHGGLPQEAILSAAPLVHDGDGALPQAAIPSAAPLRRHPAGPSQGISRG
jgi:hypothetical protein